MKQACINRLREHVVAIYLDINQMQPVTQFKNSVQSSITF